MNTEKLTDTLATGLGVTKEDKSPVFLEAIAIALGYSSYGSDNLLSQVNGVAEAIGRIADAVEAREPAVSLRDQFAMAALQGIMANPACVDSGLVEDAKLAYRAADEMMKARGK